VKANVYPPDILILPDLQDKTVPKHRQDKLAFGTVKGVKGLVNKLLSVCDDCEGDDERATRYYLHKQLKNFCLPRDVMNIKRCQLIFETFDSLDRVWFSRGRRGKA
jgi:hypothetical protein